MILIGLILIALLYVVVAIELKNRMKVILKEIKKIENGMIEAGILFEYKKEDFQNEEEQKSRFSRY